MIIRVTLSVYNKAGTVQVLEIIKLLPLENTVFNYWIQQVPEWRHGHDLGLLE